MLSAEYFGAKIPIVFSSNCSGIGVLPNLHARIVGKVEVLYERVGSESVQFKSRYDDNTAR